MTRPSSGRRNGSHLAPKPVRGGNRYSISGRTKTNLVPAVSVPEAGNTPEISVSETAENHQIGTHPGIFRTWLPLAVMWVIMAVEQPVIAAFVARMDNAVSQLAAFGLTFSLALFVEGPVVQMLAAGTALADCRENYRRIMGIMHLIGWSATVLHGLLCLPGVFTPFARSIMKVPEELMEPARLALLAMLPWTLAVGYRRLWQGVLIRYGRTGVIPVTMTIRILSSVLVLFWGFRTQMLPGAVLGGLALSVGATAGAVAARVFAAPVLKRMPAAEPENRNVVGNRLGTTPRPSRMSMKAMILFYLPLALTSFLNLGARPVMQMGLARGLLPLESLAIWPVSMGYLFLYTSFSLSSQEVVIARLEDAESRRLLIRFNSALAAVLSAIYLLVLTTPLWRQWFSGLSGLSEELTALSRNPLFLSFPVVPLSAWISLQRGALVRMKRTAEVTLGIIVNVSVLLITLFVGVAILPAPAIAIMSASYALAFLAEFIYLSFRRPLSGF